VTWIEYIATRPPACHTSRLVVPSFFPVTRTSPGETATASETSGSPIENRWTGAS
jgi:hypothetical protein